MAEAKLEALGLEVPIGLFRVYHDEGFVRDISKHEKMLNKIYGKDDFTLWEYFFPQLKPLGQCYVGKGLLRKHVHICYLDVGDDSQNIEIRAHEETHALQELNRLDSLEVALKERQGVSLSLDSLGKEVVACIGGLFAIDERGFSPCELSSYKGDTRHREAAQQLYLQGKLREREGE